MLLLLFYGVSEVLGNPFAFWPAFLQDAGNGGAGNEIRIIGLMLRFRRFRDRISPRRVCLLSDLVFPFRAPSNFTSNQIGLDGRRFSVEVTEVSTANQEMDAHPPLFIKPINLQGQGIAGRERLEDRGTLNNQKIQPISMCVCVCVCVCQLVLFVKSPT